MNTAHRALLLPGKPLAEQVTAQVKSGLAELQAGGLRPKLVSVLASADPASEVYAQSKAKQAKRLNVEFEIRNLGENATQRQLGQTLRELSEDESVHGVMLELPLAEGLDADDALFHLCREKDIEGLSPGNLARVASGQEHLALLPPTPRSVRYLLRWALGNNLRGKRVAVVGPGRTVGRPLVWMLNNLGATVTVMRECEENLAEILALQDAVCCAVGLPNLLRKAHLQPHHVVVDAGINVLEDGVTGDVSEDAAEIVRAITPVPGGVGVLTNALMYQNLLRAIRLQQNEKPDVFKAVWPPLPQSRR